MENEGLIDTCDICGKELKLTAYSDHFENIICCSKQEHDLYFSDFGAEEGKKWIEDFPGFSLKRRDINHTIGTQDDYWEYDPETSQKQFCEKTNEPLFMPVSGVCFKCGKYIFDDKETAEKADKEVITGCPFCNKSFID